MPKVTVLEVDQWTSTGDLGKFTMAEVEQLLKKGKKPEVHGGDSEAIRLLEIDQWKIREVDEQWMPPLARVWFIEGPDGKLTKWYGKENYDSSG